MNIIESFTKTHFFLEMLDMDDFWHLTHAERENYPFEVLTMRRIANATVGYQIDDFSPIYESERPREDFWKMGLDPKIKENEKLTVVGRSSKGMSFVIEREVFRLYRRRPGGVVMKCNLFIPKRYVRKLL